MWPKKPVQKHITTFHTAAVASCCALGTEAWEHVCQCGNVCVHPNVWVSLRTKAVYICLLVCSSFSDEGFVVAMPRLISHFVCLVGLCWWMTKTFDWSVWRRREPKKDKEEKISREKWQMKTGGKKRTGNAEWRKNEGVKRQRGQKGNRTQKERERIGEKGMLKGKRPEERKWWMSGDGFIKHFNAVNPLWISLPVSLSLSVCVAEREWAIAEWIVSRSDTALCVTQTSLQSLLWLAKVLSPQQVQRAPHQCTKQHCSPSHINTHTHKHTHTGIPMLPATQRHTFTDKSSYVQPIWMLNSRVKTHSQKEESCWINYWLSVCHPWPAVATRVPVQCLRAISADSKETGNMIADHWEAGSLRLQGLRDFFKWFSAPTSCWVKLMCSQGAVIYFCLP